MQYNSLIERLQNLTNREITQAELCRVLEAKQSTISNRQIRNSNFKADEIEKINEYYGVDLYSNTPKSDIVKIASFIQNGDRIEINYWSELPEELRYNRIR